MRATGELLRAERLDEDRERLRDADRVGDLDLAAVGETGGDDVLRHVARRVRGRAVDLRRVLAGERAAAVRGRAAVGVDDDLAPGQAGVAHRAADHELAGRVDVDERRDPRGSSRRRDRCGRIGRSTCSIRSGLIIVSGSSPSRCCVEMRTRSISTGRLAPVCVDLVADRHLRLAVRPQIRQHVRLAHFGEPLRDAVREHDRQRHQLARLVRRVAEHHSLVARADPVERIVVAGSCCSSYARVDALRDVGRLLVERDDHAARLGVEPVLGARVADRPSPSRARCAGCRCTSRSSSRRRRRRGRS